MASLMKFVMPFDRTVQLSLVRRHRESPVFACVTRRGGHGAVDTARIMKPFIPG
jgi:hypothetical protein